MPTSVLVVDPSVENREVLRTVLHQRGLRFYEADEAHSGLALAREYHPNIIVLDMDSDDALSGTVESELRQELDHECSSLIILGRIRRDSLLSGSRVLSKPYHFAPLVHAIEELAAKAA